MNLVDVGIVVILLFFIVTAFAAGLVREIIGTAAVLAGAVLAGLFYQNVADTLLSSIDNPSTASVVGFLIIFLGFWLAGQLLAMVIHPVISVLQLGMADQFIGAGFGFVKGFLIIEVLLVLFVTYPRYDMDKRINDSEFAAIMLNVSQPVVKILPAIFEKRVDAFK